MMKVFIQTDIEAISGCTAGGYGVSRDAVLEMQYRELMMGEINAVVAGCVEAGAEEIIVAEAHPIDLARLHPAARLARGIPLPQLLKMRQFDAGMFVGQHGRTGVADAVRAHTGSSKSILEFKVNGRDVGEFALCAGLLGAYGTPAVFLSGDDVCCREAADFCAGITTVAVEEAAGIWGAICLPPAQSHPLLTAGALAALADTSRVQPLVFDTPVTFQIEFTYAVIADDYSKIPGTRRLDARTVECTCPTYLEAHRLGYETLGSVLYRYDS